jgi:hypothetical protein
VVCDDSRTIELRGTAPTEPGLCELELSVRFTCRTHDPVVNKKSTVKWE